ncbi:MAG: cytochrome c-type biogenesis protein CcmH [Acetobacter fabarum]|jgi:cytochrome c-type biogenesis protein CcmH|uniref:cytochrome c-type biogenesis protein n=1 Tax=Acetobacter fabarum TaxID=483199 RepID=UPI00242C52B8|nr:cytochrome c-type biogenesis protein [Acetobacter fabarum]MCH4026999.1 cytochrome c-type biogenesis protein CcmH [Acetobacter fabarum]MCH4055548.1 cytochrome c-type biogenesis protein CcmH [Acetobacter fabarum]MCH4085140.1 cytochrome c-type biogenesis protein CcmH [Acetobacter fabarum]MCH4127654.1 cytochrome c-type biogenesis protein CcmH [Acetobacter fabarum]MCH4137617.1 cytochrome c-type biogenesis protein CcmH [Acetobacter fabarum]
MTIRRKLAALVAGLLLMATPVLVLAVDDPSEMLPNPQQEARAQAIGAQLRCLVCQNESIEDSSAGLARDLRRVVREHVAKGENNQQVMDWMVSRYGNFIRLKPAFSPGTLLLWAMPALALLMGIGTAFLFYRRRAAAPPPPPLTEDEKARLARLTKD